MLVHFHMFFLTTLGIALIGAGALALGAKEFGGGLLIAAGIIALIGAFAGSRS